MQKLYRQVYINGLRIDPPTEADPQPVAGYMASLRINPEQQMRNVAAILRQYTEIKRAYNGKGRAKTYAADIDTIAGTARQLAEMVEQYFNNELQEIDNELPF